MKFQFCCEWDNIVSLLFSTKQHLFIVVLFCADHTQARRCKEKTCYIYRMCVRKDFERCFEIIQCHFAII